MIKLAIICIKNFDTVSDLVELSANVTGDNARGALCHVKLNRGERVQTSTKASNRNQK